MRWIINLVVYFPVWAFPLALMMFQLGLHYRRKKSKERFLVWGMGVLLLGAVGAWFFYRMDINGVRWMRETFGIEAVQWNS